MASDQIGDIHSKKNVIQSIAYRHTPTVILSMTYPFVLHIVLSLLMLGLISACLCPALESKVDQL